jgi:hypothetical protein
MYINDIFHVWLCMQHPINIRVETTSSSLQIWPNVLVFFFNAWSLGTHSGSRQAWVDLLMSITTIWVPDIKTKLRWAVAKNWTSELFSSWALHMSPLALLLHMPSENRSEIQICKQFDSLEEQSWTNRLGLSAHQIPLTQKSNGKLHCESVEVYPGVHKKNGKPTGEPQENDLQMVGFPHQFTGG